MNRVLRSLAPVVLFAVAAVMLTPRPAGAFHTPRPLQLAQGKASGKLSVDGLAVSLNHVYSEEEPDLFDDKNTTVELTFTEKPRAEGGDEMFEMKQAGNTYVVQIKLNRNEPAKNLTASVWNVGQMSSAADAIAATPLFKVEIEIVRFDESGVEGRVYTRQAEKWIDRSYELDVRFNSLVKVDPNQRPVTAASGKPLPAGGGEPGKVYLQFASDLQKATTIEDLQQLENKYISKTHTSGKSVEEFFNNPRFNTPQEKEEAKQAWLELIKSFSLSDAKVTGGFIAGDKATLSVSGAMGKNVGLGRVNMHLVNGQWKVGETSNRVTEKLISPKPVATNSRTTNSRTTNSRAAATPAVPMAKSNGTVLGTFTLNGRAVRLRNVVARRLPSRPPERQGLIDLFLTDKPVPEEALKRISDEVYKIDYLTADYFKETAITGIYMRINKGRSSGSDEKIIYGLTLIAPASYPIGLEEFSSFNMQNGRITAKAEHTGDQGGVKWNYSLNISAALDKLAGEASRAATTATGARNLIGVPPDEGRASGRVQIKDQVIDLKYAYTWSERIFFDEPDELIHVLVTESIVAKDPKIFSDRWGIGLLIGSDRIRGIELILDPTGAAWGSNFLLKSETLNDRTDRTKMTDFKMDNGRVTGKAEYRGEDGIRTFNVSFDAPFKR